MFQFIEKKILSPQDFLDGTAFYALFYETLSDRAFFVRPGLSFTIKTGDVYF